MIGIFCFAEIVGRDGDDSTDDDDDSEESGNNVEDDSALTTLNGISSKDIIDPVKQIHGRIITMILAIFILGASFEPACTKCKRNQSI